MSKFKEMIAKDMRSVFINQTEFAEEHTIDGNRVLLVLDRDIYSERRESRREDGVYVNYATFFVDEAVLGYRPVENQLIVFDGHQAIVTAVDDEMGMLAVTIEVNLS